MAGSFKNASIPANSSSEDSSTGFSNSNSVEVSPTTKISAASSVVESDSSCKLKSAKLEVKSKLDSASANIAKSFLLVFVINSSETSLAELVISSANKIKLSSLLCSRISNSCIFAVVSGG